MNIKKTLANKNMKIKVIPKKMILYKIRMLNYNKRANKSIKQTQNNCNCINNRFMNKLAN